MTPKPPLTPFADELPLPPRLIASELGERFSVPIRTGTHRFHRCRRVPQRELPQASRERLTRGTKPRRLFAVIPQILRKG
jgi:hypothetical protein